MMTTLVQQSSQALRQLRPTIAYVALVSHKQGKLKYAAFCLERLLGTHGGCISTSLTKGCEPTLKW